MNKQCPLCKRSFKHNQILIPVFTVIGVQPNIAISDNKLYAHLICPGTLTIKAK